MAQLDDHDIDPINVPTLGTRLRVRCPAPTR
jgi:hypothetical protein